ncbi:DUF4838 domain-containing protein [Propionibacteriaceae bacterium Y2011]
MTGPGELTRRQVLTMGSAAAGGLLLGGPGLRANAAPAANGRGVPIVVDGVPASVVIAADASDQIKAAAATLIEYVAKASGITLPLHTPQDVPATGNRIYLGITGSGSHRGAAHRVADLADDGFVIGTADTAVTILAPSDHGVRHGVLELLERHVGVRWLLPGPDGEDVPEASSLVVPKGIQQSEPTMAARVMSPLYEENSPFSPDWASDDPQVVWGSRIRLRRTILAHHNLWSIFPVEQYGQTHPEYYPVIGGEPRIPAPGARTGWQPHFSEPGTVEVAVQFILDHFAANPKMTSFSLGVNDGAGYSEDDLEPAVDGAAPSASESFYQWANTVVETVIARNPALATKYFGLLAYRNVATPPTFPIHPQVVPFVTVDRYGWVDPDFRAADQALTQAWAAVAPSFGFYEYAYGATYCIPRVYNHTMGEVYRYGVEHGVTAQYSELYPNWGEGPKPWLYGKLLWDPTRDVTELEQEWYDRAVGPSAAPHLASYFSLWEGIWRDRVPSTTWFTSAVEARNPYFYFNYADYLEAVTPADAATARGHLEAARDATSTAAQRTRAEMLLTSFGYYEGSILSYPPTAGPADTTAEALAILDDVSDHLATRVEQSRARLALVAELASDPVLKHALRPETRGMCWTGFSGPQLWSVVDHVTEHEPAGGPVTDRLAALAGDPAPTPTARVARLTRSLLDGTAVQLITNGSFADGTTDWRTIGAWRVDDEIVHTGTTALRLGAVPGADLRQRFPVRSDLLAFRFRYHVPVGAPGRGFLTVSVGLHDAAGARIGILFQRLVGLQATPGQWHSASLLEDIPPTFRGRGVASVEMVIGVAGVNYPGSDFVIDDVEAHQVPQSAAGNLLPNGGFEEVTGSLPTHWTRAGATVASSTAEVRTGQRSVMLDDRSTAGGAVLSSPKLTATVGTTYTASVEILNQEGSASYLSLEFWDGAGARLVAHHAWLTEHGAWQPVTVTKPAPEGAVAVSVRLWRDSTGTGVSYYDDASLVAEA